MLLEFCTFAEKSLNKYTSDKFAEFDKQFGMSDELLRNGLKCLWVFLLGQERENRDVPQAQWADTVIKHPSAFSFLF